MDIQSFLEHLAQEPLLGSVMQTLVQAEHDPTLYAHWTQGEFHHDLIFTLATRSATRCALVVSTNCNGGVKELQVFAHEPARWALWHDRCPKSSEFSGVLPKRLGRVRTEHWFDPCALLQPDARSELRPEYRRRQYGGGWVPVDSDEV